MSYSCLTLGSSDHSTKHHLRWTRKSFFTEPHECSLRLCTVTSVDHDDTGCNTHTHCLFLSGPFHSLTRSLFLPSYSLSLTHCLLLTHTASTVSVVISWFRYSWLVTMFASLHTSTRVVCFTMYFLSPVDPTKHVSTTWRVYTRYFLNVLLVPCRSFYSSLCNLYVICSSSFFFLFLVSLSHFCFSCECHFHLPCESKHVNVPFIIAFVICVNESATHCFCLFLFIALLPCGRVWCL